MAQTFGVDKNVVYRVLAEHYRPAPRGTGPSWLSFIGHTRDSLWSVDLFRCESIVLRSYWVLVVIDQFTRRIVGFGVQCGTATGGDVCRMLLLQRGSLPCLLGRPHAADVRRWTHGRSRPAERRALGFPLRGTLCSSQSPPDNEFETHRKRGRAEAVLDVVPGHDGSQSPRFVISKHLDWG